MKTRTAERAGHDSAVAKAVLYGLPVVSEDGTQILLGLRGNPDLIGEPVTRVPVYRLETVRLAQIPIAACERQLRSSPGEVSRELAESAVDAYLVSLSDRSDIREVTAELECGSSLCGWVTKKGKASPELDKALRRHEFWLISSAECVSLNRLWRGKEQVR